MKIFNVGDLVCLDNSYSSSIYTKYIVLEIDNADHIERESNVVRVCQEKVYYDYKGKANTIPRYKYSDLGLTCSLRWNLLKQEDPLLRNHPNQHVIRKIQEMQARRKDQGYAF
jgi:hypothetical protein